jgi:hypothetical protein
MDYNKFFFTQDDEMNKRKFDSIDPSAVVSMQTAQAPTDQGITGGLQGAATLASASKGNSGVAGSAIQGAAGGASLGAAAGPWGAGIGAGVGLLSGLFGGAASAEAKKKEEERQKNIAAANSKAQIESDGIARGTAATQSGINTLLSGISPSFRV